MQHFCLCFLASKPVPDDSSPEMDTIQDFSVFKNNIAKAFVRLISVITELLEKLKSKFPIMRRACISQIRTPEGAKLPPIVVEQINATTNLDELLKVLEVSPYWSWIDLRLLEALVTASGSAAAEKTIANYKAVIFSKKLNEVLPYIPRKEIRDEYFSKIVSKLNKDADDVTVADLLSYQSALEKVIMGIGDGTCALEHFEYGCIMIYLYIPNCHAEHAYHAASSQLHKFCDLDLNYLQIGSYSKIFNPELLKPSFLKPHHLLGTTGKIIMHALLATCK